MKTKVLEFILVAIVAIIITVIGYSIFISVSNVSKKYQENYQSYIQIKLDHLYFLEKEYYQLIESDIYDEVAIKNIMIEIKSEVSKVPENKIPVSIKYLIKESENENE